jgi:GTPases
VVALVGYTNAGKTTLLNHLTGAEHTAADRLFVTLDPAARLVSRAPHAPFILTDTVGFIRKLPHQLVAAFKATLEELEEADVLLHVVDASHPALEEQMEAVESLLGELELGRRPTVVALNKVDRLEPGAALGALVERFDGVAVSARTGEGMDALVDRIERALSPGWSALPCGFPTVTARPSPSATSAAGCCRGPTTWTASCSRSSCPRAFWVLWSPPGRPAEPHRLSRRALSRGMIRLGLVRNG